MVWLSIRVRDMTLDTSNLFTGCYYHSMSLSVALASSQLLQRFCRVFLFPPAHVVLFFSGLKTRRRNAGVMCWTHVIAGTLAASAVVHIPRRCSLLFHLDVNETFYRASDVGRDRKLQERESSRSIFKHSNLFCILERGEEEGLDWKEKPAHLLQLRNIQKGVPSVVKEGIRIPFTAAQNATYRSLFGSQIWLAVPRFLFSILRRWLLIRRRSILCQRVNTCSGIGFSNVIAERRAWPTGM